MLLAHVAGRDQGQRLGMNVQPSDGHVDGKPHAVLAGTEQEAFLRVEDAGACGRLAETLLAALAAEAKEIGCRMGQHFLAAEAGQLKGHAADLKQPVGVGIEEEERIAGFLQENMSQVVVGRRIHGTPSSTRRRRPHLRPDA